MPGLAFAMPWSWDMFSQPSHKAQEEKALDYPEGTVPTKGSEIKLPAWAHESEEAKSLKNPVEPTTASIDRGRVMFVTHCATCHGRRGKGDGPVGKKYVPPTDLTSAYVQEKLTEGQIYYTITYGGRAIMPVYSDSLEVEDRWHIVNYIRHALTMEPR